jgi:hypothetical protein
MARTTSDVSRGSEKRFCFMKIMTRREFLGAGVGLASVVSGIEMITGCTTTEAPKRMDSAYPSPSYNRIQPSQGGCLVGFFKEPDVNARPKDSRFFPPRSIEMEAAQRARSFEEFMYMLKREDAFEKTKRYEINYEINYVTKALDAKPFIFSLPWVRLYMEFPVIQSIAVVQRGIVPFVYAHLFSTDSSIPDAGFGPKEISHGQRDGYIRKFAQGAREFGNRYGGFFLLLWMR